MKIQCSCGAKYEFDVSPEMASGPVKFVCPACGVDSSAFVTSLVRQQFGASAPMPAPAPTGPQSSAPVRIRVQPAESAAETIDAPAEALPRCTKHPGEFASEKCYICSKPICPKCMELFGYACSPLCKAKAEARGIKIPQYAGQKSVAEAQLWRKVGRITAVVLVLVVAGLGGWLWFTFIGSEPKPIFSVRFSEPAYSGQSWFCGPDQLVFLHGDTLAQYDIKLNKQLWSRQLVDKAKVAADAQKEIKDMQAANERIYQVNPEAVVKTPHLDTLTLEMEHAAAAALQLRVQGSNIWVLSPGKLTRYDRDSGKPLKEIPLAAGSGELISQGDELLLMEGDGATKAVTHINLNTCGSRTEELGNPAPPANLNPPQVPSPSSTKRGANRPPNNPAGAGLPVGIPGKDAGKAMDPEKVAQQAQHLSKAAQIALPAVLANSMNQERLLNELSDRPRTVPAGKSAAPEPEALFSLIPTRDGFIQYSVKLVEAHFIEHAALKAAPVKSALDGNLTAGNSMEAANETLNEMQHSRGGDVVREDQSRYRVTISQPGGKDEWSGEVVGPPMLFPLKTVNALAAGKTLLVFDKGNKKLWQATLSFNLSGAPAAGDDNAPYGQGPCVEHKDGLFVFDQGFLTAYDLATGNRRWSLPSIGIAGLFFDDQDMLYVNTTTASLDKLRYSRQIDITDKTSNLIVKMDSRTGKTLWSSKLGGLVTYVSGKFVYTVSSYQPSEEDQDGPLGDFEKPYLRLKRVSPKDGHMVWEHFQQRCPLDIQFDKNIIRLVFKKEVEVLKYLTM
jgi:PQQ-like domain